MRKSEADKLTDAQKKIVKEIIDIQASILINGSSKNKSDRICKRFDMLGMKQDDGLYPFFE